MEAHVERTGSSVAQGVLAEWEQSLTQFVKVMPDDYKAVLEAQAAMGTPTDVAAAA